MDTRELQQRMESLLTGWIENLPDDQSKMLEALVHIAACKREGLLDPEATKRLGDKVIERWNRIK